jgi:hypothetical protein
LNDSIAEARSEKAADTIGIVQIIKTVVKDILGVAGIRMKNATANRTTESKHSNNKLYYDDGEKNGGKHCEHREYDKEHIHKKIQFCKVRCSSEH